MVSHHTLRHRLSQLTSGFQGMIEVEARIHARPEDLVHQVARVFKHVLMNAIGEREAIGDDVDLGGAKEVRDQRGRSAGQAAVRRRVFGMVGSRSQRGARLDRQSVSAFPPPAWIAVIGLQKPYLYFPLKHPIAESATPVQSMAIIRAASAVPILLLATRVLNARANCWPVCSVQKSPISASAADRAVLVAPPYAWVRL